MNPSLLWIVLNLKKKKKNYCTIILIYREAEGVTGYHPQWEAGADDIERSTSMHYTSRG